MDHILLSENVSGGYGAAILLVGGEGNHIASYLTITNNHAGDEYDDPAIYLSECTLLMTNTIIWNNEPCQIRLGSNENHGPHDIYIVNSDIMGGEEGIINEVGGTIFWGVNNIDADPWFCDTTNFDYRLQLDSPCRTDVCGFMGYTGETCEGENIEDIVSEPTEFYLSQNYPNPFNPTTTIEFSLPYPQDIQLTVYNILGQQVQLLTEQTYSAGIHQVRFDGSGMASGVYVYRLTTGGQAVSRKMVLVR